MTKYSSPTKIALASLVLLLITTSTAALAFHLYFRDRIYPGVKIAGVSVGRLTEEEAIGQLAQHVGKAAPSSIVLFYENHEWAIELAELNFQPDLSVSVNKALNTRDPRLLYNKTVNIPFNYRLDEARLQTLSSTISAQLSFPAQEPEIILEQQQINISAGHDGQQFEEQKFLVLFKTRLARLNFAPIKLPVKKISVAIKQDEIDTVRKRAGNLLDKQLVINVEDNKTDVAGQELLALLDFRDGYNGRKIAALVKRLATSYNRPPQNAKFEMQNGRVTLFEPAAPGIEINEDVAGIQIEDSLRELEAGKEEQIEIALRYETIHPEIENSEVNNLGLQELLGQGESLFTGSAAGRIHNLSLAASRINGTLVPPDGVFSFNQTVGDISAATGYQSAYIIKDGRTILGDGGGVCQDSTTLFRAVLDAGLPIIERNQHSYRVVYYEKGGYKPGIDATVFAPSVDFKFKNDTPAHILIQTDVDKSKNKLVYEIYGTPDGRVATITNHRVWDVVPPPEPLYQDDPTLPAGEVKQIDFPAWGAKAAFDYRVERGGEVLFERTYYSNFRPWQAVYLRGTGNT